MMAAQESENAVDRPRLGDQPDNFHLPAAPRADQWVLAKDLLDQVGPAAPRGFAGDPPLLLLPLSMVLVFRGLQRSSAVTCMVLEGAIHLAIRDRPGAEEALDALAQLGAGLDFEQEVRLHFDLEALGVDQAQQHLGVAGILLDQFAKLEDRVLADLQRDVDPELAREPLGT